MFSEKNDTSKKDKSFPQTGGLGLYVHWPFCKSLCPYCDFNSYVSQTIDIDLWSKAYKKAIGISAEQSDNNTVNSIYFGGGTPSLMTPQLITDIINEIDRKFKLSNNAEITLEANPSSAEYRKFKSYSASGVNRCSLGIQALKDKDLKVLGRLHSVSDALQAYDLARTWFKSSSFDLIYGRQNQTVKEWEEELKRALNLNPQHLSLYQLTIEPGTHYFRLQEINRLKGLPDNKELCSLYEKTKELCANHNMVHYEISNFAFKGEESSHNLNYWRYGEFIGLGPGACGRVLINGKKYETETHKDPKKWIDGVVGKFSQIYSRKKPLTLTEQANEYAIMSLRLKEGLSISRFNNLSGSTLSENKVAELENLGLIRRSKNYLIKTNKGELLLNSILNYILN